MDQKLIAAVSIILWHEDRVLLVEWASGPSAGSFAFPGGKVEAGESLEAAALRELGEETGLRAGGLARLRDYRIDTRASRGTDGAIYALTVFTADLLGPAQPVPGDDACSAGWFTVEESMTLTMPDSVRDCIALLAELKQP